MQRVTITIDDELLAALDALMAQRGHTSRSEAIRDLVRDGVRQDRGADPDAPCVATLSYVYDHETRDLAQRLIHAQHDRHDLGVANLHVHLDHDACLEIAVLRGPAAAVQGLAAELTGQRGVRHAALHVIPVEVSSQHHHGEGGEPHVHIRA